MAKSTFKFDATGRELFASERVLLQVFNAKYSATAKVVTDEVVRSRMDEVRTKVRESFTNGEPRTTAFYEDVQQAKLAAAPEVKPAAKPRVAKQAAKLAAQPKAKALVKPAAPKAQAAPKPSAAAPEPAKPAEKAVVRRAGAANVAQMHR